MRADPTHLSNEGQGVIEFDGKSINLDELLFGKSE